MNLRIDKNDFRFRVTSGELDELLQGKTVSHCTCLGTVCITCRILPQDKAEIMFLEIAANEFSLWVPPSTLEGLGNMGRSKNGYSVLQDGVRVSLQVDLKKSNSN